MASPLQLASYVQQQGEMGRQRGQQNQLAQLASQSYGAPQESQNALLSQMAAIDPRAAQAQQGQFQQEEDRTGQQLRGYVDYVNKARASGNPMAVNAALRAGAPLIQRLTGKTLPTEWTPDMDAGWAELEAKVAMSPAGAGGAGVQSTYIDGEGNRVAIMRDGSTQVLGKNDAGATQQTINIPGPDGRPAQYTFDRRTGNYVPAGQGMGAPQQQAPAAPATTQFMGPDGTPVQIGNDIPEHVRQQILANPQAFQDVPDGTQAQMPDRPVQQFSGGGQVASAPQAGSQFVGRRPEDEAAAVEAAKLQTQLGFMPAQQQIETRGAVDRATQLNQLETAADTVSSAPGAIATLQQSVDSIDALLNSPNLERVVGIGSVNPLNLVPGTEARGLIARADQIAGQSFLAAFNQLKGGGAITEREGEAATKAMARLDRSQGIEDYRTALNELKSAIAPAIERQRSSLARAQQTVGGGAAAAPVQRARNAQTGEVLELRNGQWVPAR